MHEITHTVTKSTQSNVTPLNPQLFQGAHPAFNSGNTGLIFVNLIFLFFWHTIYVLPYPLNINLVALKHKGKVHPRPGHEGPEAEHRDSSTLPLTSVLDEGGWSMPRPSRFIAGQRLISIVQEAGWPPRPVWMCADNLAPTGIQSPDCPAHSTLLY
jgi:hypothetical protein